jgi:uncharacterized protein YuzE
MKISYDVQTDTLSLIFRDRGILSRDLGDGVVADYDPARDLTRSQIPHATMTAAGKDVFRQIVVEGIGPFGPSDPLIIVPRLFENSQLLD